MKRLFVLLLVPLVWIASAMYVPSDDDVIVADVITDRITNIIDDNPKISPENVILAIDAFVVAKADLMTDRQIFILSWVVEEVAFAYDIKLEPLSENELSQDEWSASGDHEEGLEWDTRTYIIRGDTIELGDGNGDQEKDREIWELFKDMIPRADREDIASYQVVDDTDSDIAAEVRQSLDDPAEWMLVVNLAVFYPNGEFDATEAIYTLVHEYAHVMTLGDDQVNLVDLRADDDEYEEAISNCPTLWVSEWCLYKDSYLFEYIREFWNDNQREYANQGGDVYTGNEDDFVNDYAATNPGEDIAETFAYFVLNEKPDPDETADEKIRFFYDYDELEQLRERIRIEVFEYDVLDKKW